MSKISEATHNAKQKKRQQHQQQQQKAIGCGCIVAFNHTYRYWTTLQRINFVECLKSMRLANAYGKRRRQSCHTTTDNNEGRSGKKATSNVAAKKKRCLAIEDRSMAICSSHICWYGLEKTFFLLLLLPCTFFSLSLSTHLPLECSAVHRTCNDCVEQHRFTRCYRKLIVENCLLSHLLLVHLACVCAALKSAPKKEKHTHSSKMCNFSIIFNATRSLSLKCIGHLICLNKCALLQTAPVPHEKKTHAFSMELATEKSPQIHLIAFHLQTQCHW